jgi:hypothetical protein
LSSQLLVSEPPPAPLAGWSRRNRYGRVRGADRHPAPLSRQPPGQHRQPPRGQQRGGQHEPAAGQPEQESEQVARVLAVEGKAVIQLVLEELSQAERGEDRGRGQQRQQHRPGQDQPEERQGVPECEHPPREPRPKPRPGRFASAGRHAIHHSSSLPPGRRGRSGARHRNHGCT